MSNLCISFDNYVSLSDLDKSCTLSRERERDVILIHFDKITL